MGIWTRIWPALALTTLLGVILFVPLSWAAVSFLRDRMRYRCSYFDGSFTCADGVGYALPVIALGFCAGLLLLAAAIFTAMLGERPLLASRVVAGVGMAGLIVTVLTSIAANSGRYRADGVPDDTWSSVMATPSLLLGAASIALLLAVVSPSRFPRAGLWIALGSVLATTLVEPTLAFGTVPALFAVALALSSASASVARGESGARRTPAMGGPQR